MADLIPVCPAWERCGGGFKCQTNVTGIKQKYTFFLWDMTVKYNMSTYFCWKLWMAKKIKNKIRVCTFLHKHTWILYLNHPAHVGMVITDKFVHTMKTRREMLSLGTGKKLKVFASGFTAENILCKHATWMNVVAILYLRYCTLLACGNRMYM